MKRTALLLVCVLVSASTALAWISSGRSRGAHFFRNYSESGSLMIACRDGQVRLSHWLAVNKPVRATSSSFDLLGFGGKFERAGTPLGTSFTLYRAWLPAWFVIVVASAYPLVALVRGPWTRRRRRRRNNQCVECGRSLRGVTEALCPFCGATGQAPCCVGCGYNLTGNTSGACPECGKATGEEPRVASEALPQE